MNIESVDAAIVDGGAGLRLLDHPFYTRWSRGELTMDDLAGYAAQYRHFEEMLPDLLAELERRASSGGASSGGAAELIARNLKDEAGGDPTHLELFDRFASAVGAGTEPPGPAARYLVETYRRLARDPAGCLAAIAAYERQASEVAATKAAGLRTFYGVADPGVAFWDVHAELDADHAQWAMEAIAQLPAEPGAVGRAARRASEAWWSFLDEREAALAG